MSGRGVDLQHHLEEFCQDQGGDDGVAGVERAAEIRNSSFKRITDEEGEQIVERGVVL